MGQWHGQFRGGMGIASPLTGNPGMEFSYAITGTGQYLAAVINDFINGLVRRQHFQMGVRH